MKHNLTLRYAMIVMTYWIGFAIIGAFASLYLLDLGLSNTMIGLVLAVSGGGAAVLQPIVSTWAERPNSPPLKKIACIITLVVAGIALLIHFTAPLGKLLGGVLYGSAIMLMQVVQPMINSLGMESINRGENLNFGVARAGGSVGYALVSYTMGFLAAKYTPKIIPLTAAAFLCVFALVVICYPQEKAPVLGSSTRYDQSSLSVVGFFKKYRRFGAVLIGCMLVITSHSIVNTFNLQIIMHKGGGSEEMGVATAIAACIEIPGMVLFSVLARKFRFDTLLITSAVFFTLKCLGSLLAPSIAVYYIVQLCQMLGWGLFAVVFVRYTNGVMQPQDTIKGQGYGTMAQSIATVLGTVVGGRLMDVSGVDAMLLFGVCAATLGTIIMLLSVEKVRQ